MRRGARRRAALRARIVTRLTSSVVMRYTYTDICPYTRRFYTLILRPFVIICIVMILFHILVDSTH